MTIIDTQENGGEVYKVCPMCSELHQGRCKMCNKCCDALAEDESDERARMDGDYYTDRHA